MFRKLTYILGLAIVLSSVPVTSIAQVKVTTEEHHTRVKRTVRKGNNGEHHAYGKDEVKPGVRHAYGKSKRGYMKTKNRIKNGDAKQDAKERNQGK